MIRNPDINATIMPQPDGSILMHAPDLGESCGMVTANLDIATAFMDYITGVISPAGFIDIIVALNPEWLGVANMLMRSCGAFLGVSI